MKKRYQKILQYRKCHTLKETGKKFGITGERVRQIEHISQQKRCATHDRLYYNKCSFCISSQNYSKFINSLDKQAVIDESNKESLNSKRDYLSVERKKYLIEILFEKYGYSFSEIARLLNRHYSSITNLYSK